LIPGICVLKHFFFVNGTADEYACLTLQASVLQDRKKLQGRNTLAYFDEEKKVF
jgi:hypothetical protein